MVFVPGQDENSDEHQEVHNASVGRFSDAMTNKSTVENLDAMFSREARFIRKVSGNGELETTMRKAVKALANNAIPHLIAGGIAVQERGYPRNTIAVDIIVPNIRTAYQALLEAGFEQSKKSRNAVVDPKSKFEVDLLPGGKRLLPNQPLHLPLPTAVSDEPQIVPLDSLINMKLSAGWAKDFADVVQLIIANFLLKSTAPTRLFKSIITRRGRRQRRNKRRNACWASFDSAILIRGK